MTTDPACATPATVHPVPAAGDELTGWYTAGAWQAAELGLAAARGAGAVSFTRIDPPGAQAFKRFSGFLGDCQPPVQQPAGHQPCAARAVPRLDGAAAPDSTKTLSRVLLRTFPEDNRRYNWLPGIPAGGGHLPDEICARRRALPRFIPVRDEPAGVR